MVLAIGTRLMDFTTGSWTVFAMTPEFISHQRCALGRDQAPGAGGGRRRPRDRGRARRGLAATGRRRQLDRNARKPIAEWNALLDDYQKPTNAPVPTYAQVVGVVHCRQASATRSSPPPAACRAS